MHNLRPNHQLFSVSLTVDDMAYKAILTKYFRIKCIYFTSTRTAWRTPQQDTLSIWLDKVITMARGAAGVGPAVDQLLVDLGATGAAIWQ